MDPKLNPHFADRKYLRDKRYSAYPLGVTSKLKVARFEISATVEDGSMNSTEGAAPSEQNPGAQLAAGSTSDSHKPIHHTSSVPHFGIEERRIHRLQVDEFDGRRSRSHSEPLTREAVKIAQELRKASDLFNTNYEVSSPTVKRGFRSYPHDKSRRATLAGGESLRQEINQVLGNKYASMWNPLPPEGTPV